MARRPHWHESLVPQGTGATTRFVRRRHTPGPDFLGHYLRRSTRPAIVADLDTEQVIRWNDAAAGLLSLPPADESPSPRGPSLQELFAPEDRRRVAEVLARCRAE